MTFQGYQSGLYPDFYPNDALQQPVSIPDPPAPLPAQAAAAVRVVAVAIPGYERIARLEQAIGYRFKNLQRIKLAYTEILLAPRVAPIANAVVQHLREDAYEIQTIRRFVEIGKGLFEAEMARRAEEMIGSVSLLNPMPVDQILPVNKAIVADVFLDGGFGAVQWRE